MAAHDVTRLIHALAPWRAPLPPPRQSRLVWADRAARQLREGLEISLDVADEHGHDDEAEERAGCSW